MRDPSQSTRRVTFELTLPTVLTADQLALVTRIGKSEMMEASLNWFVALVTVYASCTGITQTQAARALVQAAPSTKEIPCLPDFLENEVAREFVKSLIGEIEMNGTKARNQSALEDFGAGGDE